MSNIVIGICNMFGKCNGNIVLIENSKNSVIIIINLHGLKPNSIHAMHIHETGDLSDGCNSLLAHYNPHGMQHGGPNDKNRHIGDFGNIKADSNGNVNIQFEVSKVKLRGKYSVIGRSIVIHEGIDDLGKGLNKESKITGNSGSRIACGVIGYSKKSKLYF